LPLPPFFFCSPPYFHRLSLFSLTCFLSRQNTRFFCLLRNQSRRQRNVRHFPPYFFGSGNVEVSILSSPVFRHKVAIAPFLVRTRTPLPFRLFQKVVQVFATSFPPPLPIPWPIGAEVPHFGPTSLQFFYSLLQDLSPICFTSLVLFYIANPGPLSPPYFRPVADPGLFAPPPPFAERPRPRRIIVACLDSLTLRFSSRPRSLPSLLVWFPLSFSRIYPWHSPSLSHTLMLHPPGWRLHRSLSNFQLSFLFSSSPLHEPIIFGSCFPLRFLRCDLLPFLAIT